VGSREQPHQLCQNGKFEIRLFSHRCMPTQGLAIEDVHVTSTMTSPMVAAMLEVFFSRRAGRFNRNNDRKRPKIGHLSRF
jgi:hypothetical protein